ncbi:MAG TPA: molybdenum cofactor guanylyltransferase MobA [Nevskiales bacterium]|nr:molybdenum cofactor guanylyltransferase MobA [Nevskiales bacterium]
MKAHTPSVTGAILAGGLGRRLGGVDKGLMPVAGQPLIERALACLLPQVDQVLINANRHHAEYARYGYPVVADGSGDYQGPLAGMASVLAAAHTDYVLCVPCDAAWLPPDLVSRMLAALAEGRGKVCAVHDGVWLHPVCALIPRSALPDLRRWLAEGRREVAGWLQNQGLVTVDYRDWPSVFWSINTPDDLAAVERRLQSSPVAPPALILKGAA